MLNAPAPELLAAIIDSSDDGIVSKTLQGIITSWNRSAERIFGYSAEEAVGRHISILFPPERLPEEQHFLREIGAGRRVEHFETERVRKDGSRVQVSVTLSPVRDASGRIAGVSKIVRDISRRVELERRAARAAAAQQLIVSLNDATRDLRDPEAVLWEVVTRVGAHFQVGRCTYGEVDAAQEHFRVTRDYTNGVRSVAGRHRLDEFGPALIRELETGRTVAVGDVALDAGTTGHDAAFAALQTRAFICVPLVKQGRFVALLVLHHPEPRAWSEDDVALLEQIAERTWFAVESARSEAALHESRQVLSLAMRNGGMGAWSRNLLTDEVWWSRELEELFGLEPGGFTGTRAGFLALVHDEDRDGVQAAVNQAVAGGTDYQVEFRFRHATGGWRWMEGRGRAVHADGGTPVALYGLGIDITPRKQFEEALAAAKDAADADAQRLNVALAAARLGDWIWDAATDVVTLSPRAAEIFDIPAGPSITWTALRQLIHFDDREHTRRAVEDALAGEGDYTAEYRLINGGRERWVCASGRARYDERGRAASMFGVVQDITRDRLLVRLDDAVRSLSDPEAITFTAARVLGEHLRVNRCAYASVQDDAGTFALTGNYTRDAASIVGQYPLCRFGTEFERLMRHGQPHVVTDSETDPRLDEAERSAYRDAAVRGAVCVAILKAGRLVAVLAVHTTAPRQWRPDEIELVQQVASRCWESIERARVERERVHLLEAAEAANRAKDEFMAMLGHELRNPLSPILTALQLMKLRGDESERERTVIERQVAHLTRLVDDLLDVSRIARGKVELKPEVVELSEIVARAIEVASPLLEERRQTLTVDVPATGCAVHGDPGRLSQVVSNLLTNAAKYTPPGGTVSVVVSSHGDDLVLRVRDTGIGIPADVLPRVFDLFVQGRQAIDRAQGGLGLGLTIVRSLVERHGGRVAAHSDGPDRGSEFVVWLPRGAGGRPVEGPRATVPASLTSATPRLRILIVDDNEDAAEMLAQALTLQGHDTRIAHDGLEALRLAATFHADAAFLDIGLPVMDGYELAARLRELPGMHSVRLIAVTGYGQASDRRRTAEAGFSHHVVKPVDLDQLLTLIAPESTDSVPR